MEAPRWVSWSTGDEAERGEMGERIKVIMALRGGFRGGRPELEVLRRPVSAWRRAAAGDCGLGGGVRHALRDVNRGGVFALCIAVACFHRGQAHADTDSNVQQKVLGIRTGYVACSSHEVEAIADYLDKLIRPNSR